MNPNRSRSPFSIPILGGRYVKLERERERERRKYIRGDKIRKSEVELRRAGNKIKVRSKIQAGASIKNMQQVSRHRLLCVCVCVCVCRRKPPF